VTTMNNFVVFTNNPAAAEFFDVKFPDNELRWFASPAMEVLTASKTAVRQGAVLLSNPLAGVRSEPSFFPLSPAPRASVLPTKAGAISPFLTLLVSEPSETVDFLSVKNIDAAISFYKKNARLRFMSYKEDALKSFQVSDLEAVAVVLTSLLGV